MSIKELIGANHAHEGEISVFLNTWGNYNENGADGGAWINLPCDNLDEIMEALAEAMGDDDPEWFINDYSVDGDDLPTLNISEHSNIRDLNELAEKIAALDKWDRRTYAAAVECWGADEVDPDDLDDIWYHEDVSDDYDLGYYYAVEVGCIDFGHNEILERYFDFEAYGRDIRLEINGDFVRGGWVERC